MSPIPQSRLLCLGSAVALAFMLLAPVAVNAEEDEILALAPVAAPSVDEPSVDAVQAAARALAAQHALQSGDIGSMQEERLLAIVAAAPSWDETSGYGAVEDSRATIGHPATSTIREADLFAQFRAVELSLSRNLGVDQQVSSCAVES